MRNKARSKYGIAALAAAGALAVASSFTAAPADAVAPESEDYVVFAPEDGVQTDSGLFFETQGDDQPFAIFAEADGSLPYDVDLTQLDALIDSGLSAPDAFSSLAATNANQSHARALSPRFAYGAIGTEWGRIHTSTVYVMGQTKDTRLYYNFSAASNTSQVNAGSGLGYVYSYNSSTRTWGYYQNWYNLGSATATRTGGLSTPWGQVGAYPKFRAKCAGSLGCSGYWWH